MEDILHTGLLKKPISFKQRLIYQRFGKFCSELELNQSQILSHSALSTAREDKNGMDEDGLDAGLVYHTQEEPSSSARLILVRIRIE